MRWIHLHRVTVGMCVRNSEGTVRAAINSVVDQDFPSKDVEIIIVDGNSRDKTVDIINDVISRTKINASVFSDKGEGLGAARQMVVDNARGDYIVWVDSDVILAEGFLRRQLEFMEENPSVGMARGESEYIESGKGLSADLQDLFFNVARAGAVYMGATICRTKALRESNGFDTRIRGAAEDVDLKIRMLSKGWKTAVNNEVKFRHVSRETLRDVFREYSWYGYGDHFVNHKHEGFVDIVNRIPPTYFGWGLKVARKAYHQFHVKKSFLMPLLCVFMSVGWCIGFVKSHFEGYGHSIRKGKTRLPPNSTSKKQ